jgi:hypothetical protein
MMASDAQKLLRIKQQIKSAEQDQSRIEGQMEEIKKRLREKGIKSLKHGWKWAEEQRDKLQEMRKELKKGIQEIGI